MSRAIGAQLEASEVHNITNDVRRGHDGEAAAGGIVTAIGGPLAGFILHGIFGEKDDDELHTHDLNADVPTFE